MTAKHKTYSHDELVAMDVDVLDKMAFGYIQDQQVCVDPRKVHVYLSDMENPEYRFKNEGMTWVKSVDLSEPISLSVRGDGKLWLEDGHHRVFCARLRKEKLQAIIEIKANPVLAILNRQKSDKEQSCEPVI